MMKFLFTLCLSLSIYAAFAQPANDNCSAAIISPQNGTCVNGTTAAANDNWTGQVGCQTGGGSHPDVWYTFTATGSTAQFTITNGSMTGNIELALLDGTCAGGFAFIGTQCGASPLNAT